MNMLDTINRFYYDMALNELDLMNQNTQYPDVSYNSMLYLDLIAYKEGCTASYLAQALHISKPAVTAKVNELIRQGYLERLQSDEDRRVHYLKVKPQVAQLYKTYDRKTLYAISRMRQEYSEEELELFCKIMDSFSAHYREESDNA